MAELLQNEQKSILTDTSLPLIESCHENDFLNYQYLQSLKAGVTENTSDIPNTSST